MARKLDAMPRGTKPGSRIYPWDEWLDGNIWELTQGEDFTCTMQGFKSIARSAAITRGLRFTHKVTGEKTVAIQAVPRDLPD